MKTSEEIMEILEAYDLTGGLRAAATLAGRYDKTVAHYVALREAGHVRADARGGPRAWTSCCPRSVSVSLRCSGKEDHQARRR